MSERDPILDALQQGDEHCPDGRALAVLGRVVRTGSRLPRPVDLLAAVREGCAASSDEDAIDELYDGDSAAVAAADPQLRALADLVREGGRPERDPDLLPRLEDRFEDPRESRRARITIDPHTSWRIWTMVVVGHVAALLALAVINIQLAEEPERGDAPLIYSAQIPDFEDDALPGTLPEPATWAELAGRPGALFALRSDPDLRERARIAYRLAPGAGAVRGGLDWLSDHYDREAGVVGELSGHPGQDIATQSLAALAMLGEGVTAPRRAVIAYGLCEWIADRIDRLDEVDPTAAGLAALALVEGAVLLQNPDLETDARRALIVLADAPLDTHGGAWLLLAAETARVAGYPVPERLDARRLDAVAERDVLAVQAASGTEAGSEVIARLVSEPPAADGSGQLDLLGWWTPSLAMREMGGRLWAARAHDITATLLPVMEHSDEGRSWIPPSRVRHAEVMGPAGEVFATSLAILNLQVGYRYLPLAR